MFIKCCLLKHDKPADPIMTVFSASWVGNELMEMHPCFWINTLGRDGAIEKLTLHWSPWAVRRQGSQELYTSWDCCSWRFFLIWTMPLIQPYPCGFLLIKCWQNPKAVQSSQGSREMTHIASYFRQNNQGKEPWTMKTTCTGSKVRKQETCVVVPDRFELKK